MSIATMYPVSASPRSSAIYNSTNYAAPSSGAGSRASSSSESSSFYPVSRQGTISSRDGGQRSVRQSKRLSTAAYYTSMTLARDKEVEIEDELARGKNILVMTDFKTKTHGFL